MKKPFLYLVFSCLCLAASAQKVYFIYFQSEGQQPFYVKFKNKVFNSGSSGYVTIPNLSDSTYSFAIGFSSNTSLESKYTIPINGTDKGLLLKKFQEGPALFDLQNVSIIKPDFQETQPVVAYETRTDRFSNVLSKAAEDPSLIKVPVKSEIAKQEVEKETAVTKSEEPKETKQEEVKESQKVKSEEARDHPLKAIHVDSGNTNLTGTPATEKKQEIATAGEVKADLQTGAKSTDSSLSQGTVYSRSFISRYSETSTTEGFGLVFYDIYNGKVDTIKLVIPNPKVAFTQAEKSQKEDEGLFLDLKKEQLQKEQGFKPGAGQSSAVPSATQPEGVANPASVNSNAACQVVASEKEFLKLRRNMAGKDSDDGMVEEARKFFKKQCFTTEQLRHLSSLFLTAAGKYQFFDAAFSYASDKGNFASLQSEIRDAYYLKRFKALVGE